MSEQHGESARPGTTRREHLRRVGAAALGGAALGAAKIGGAGAWPGEAAPPAPSATGTPAAVRPALGSGNAAGGTDGGLPPFSYRLGAAVPQRFAAGVASFATATEMPTLSGLAFVLERIDPGAVRELHWNLNAHELSCCLAGTGEFGIVTDGAEQTRFPIGEGTLAFVPNGYAHWVRNTGPDPLEMLVAFTHEQPERLDLSQALPVFPQQVITQPAGVPATALPLLPTQGDGFLLPVPAWSGPSAPPTLGTAPADRYHVATADVPLKTFAGGEARILGPDVLPALAGITVYRLTLDAGALREPHWHPGTNELNFCLRGRVQFGLVAPGGDAQSFVAGPGDIAFMPSNWLHYILALDGEPAEVLVFFNRDSGPHIELSELYDAVPPEVLAASFGVDPAVFAALPKQGDVFAAGPPPE